ncbi:MAG: hypothetical protein ACRYFA_03050 [Janthinobacterium lividum]
MTTFTIQVKDNDTELLLKILQKFKVKVIEKPKNDVTIEIVEALKEIKEMQSGRSKVLSLKDI